MTTSAKAATGVAAAPPKPLAVKPVTGPALTVIEARTDPTNAAPISAFTNDMSLTWSGATWTYGLQPAGGAVVPQQTGSGSVLIRGKPPAFAGEAVVDRLKMGNSATAAGKTTLKAGLSFGDGTAELGSTLPSDIKGPVLRMTLNGQTTYLSDVDYLFFEGANNKTAPIEFAIGYGGAGNDYLNAASLVNIEKEIGGAEVPDDAYGAILLGGAGNDSMFGSDLADVMIGGSGRDNMWGGNGDDTFIGELGDIIVGGDGTRDRVEFSGRAVNYRFTDSILAGSTDKFLQVTDAARIAGVAAYVREVEEVAFGADVFRFRWGSDASKRPSNVRLMVVADRDNQTLYGGAQADLISTRTKSSTVKAGAGNDLIMLETWGGGGPSGNSTVFGGAGNDRIVIESNNNVVYGDNLEKNTTGNDAFLLREGAFGNKLYGNAGADSFFVYTTSQNNTIDLGVAGKKSSDGKIDKVYFVSDTAVRNTPLTHVGSEDFVYVARASGGAAQMTLAEVQNLFGSAVTDNKSYFWTTADEMNAQAAKFFPA